MYYLKPLDKPALRKWLYILKNRENIVGRKNCSLLICDDDSISRVHAKFIIQDNGLFLEDLGAKYNTYLNGELLAKNERKLINVGDKIKFGKLHSVFIVSELNLNVLPSNLSSELKNEVVGIIKCLDGKILDNYSFECNFLVINEIIATFKVMCAITHGVKIVTCQFFIDLRRIIKNNEPILDNYEEYQPKLSEAIINQNVDISYNANRKTLFKEKVFVFPNEALKNKYSSMIDLGAGKSTTWAQTKLTKKLLSQNSPQYVVISVPENLLTKEINGFLMSLRKMGKRPIPFQEIIFAIMKCSVEQDCNPDFDKVAILTSNAPQKNIGKVLVEETQHVGASNKNTDSLALISVEDSQLTSQNTRTSTQKIIEETLPSSLSLQCSIEESPEKNKKRQLNKEDRQESAAKKFNLDMSTSLSTIPETDNELEIAETPLSVSSKTSESVNLLPESNNKRKNTQDDFEDNLSNKEMLESSNKKRSTQNSFEVNKGVKRKDFAPTGFEDNLNEKEMHKSKKRSNGNPFQSVEVKTIKNLGSESKRNPFLMPQPISKNKQATNKANTVLSDLFGIKKPPEQPKSPEIQSKSLERVEQKIQMRRSFNTTIIDSSSQPFLTREQFRKLYGEGDITKIDPEIADDIEKFKDFVQIEEMTNFPCRRPKPQNVELHNSTGVNFKKFKKQYIKKTGYKLNTNNLVTYHFDGDKFVAEEPILRTLTQEEEEAKKHDLVLTPFEEQRKISPSNNNKKKGRDFVF